MHGNRVFLRLKQKLVRSSLGPPPAASCARAFLLHFFYFNKLFPIGREEITSFLSRHRIKFIAGGMQSRLCKLSIGIGDRVARLVRRGPISFESDTWDEYLNSQFTYYCYDWRLHSSILSCVELIYITYLLKIRHW